MSDPESLYQEAQEYKYEQRMADKDHVYPCDQCGKMTHESELEAVNNGEICRECRGKLSECHSGDVIQVGKNGSYVASREENNTGYCDTCGNIQIYSKKSGWQNYE